MAITLPEPSNVKWENRNGERAELRQVEEAAPRDGLPLPQKYWGKHRFFVARNEESETLPDFSIFQD